MAKIELDVSGDITMSEFLEMCDQYNLDFRVLETYGVGGNPLIEFAGDDDDVKRFVTENEYDNEDDY